MRLGAFYPRIITLSLSIRCSKGNGDEVSRYKAIDATLLRLKRLALTLDALVMLSLRLGPRLVG